MSFLFKYSTMNGFKYENKLVYTRPLDLLFARLETILSVLVPEFRKEEKIADKSRLREESHVDRINKLWEALTPEELNGLGEGSKESQVIKFFLTSIKKIQELTPPSIPGKDKDLLLISLYDLKIFNALTTFLVIDGIHSCLPKGIGVPIGLRTKQFGLAVSGITSTSTDLSPDNIQQLKEIFTEIVDLLKVKGDVRDLLLLGPYTVDFLSAAAAVGLNPRAPKDTRSLGVQAYNYIQRQMDSYSLYLHLTSLIRPKTPAWFIGGISHSLAVIPLNRMDGVRSLLEFVSGIREKEDVQMADLDKATRILKSIPRSVSVETYSLKIGAQMMNIVASPSSPLAVPTLQVITALFSQRPEIINLGLKKVLSDRLNPPVMEFSSEQVLVTKNEIDEAMACLYMVVTKSHAVDLIIALTDTIFLPLWTLICYLTTSKKSSDLATSLLVSILNQSDSKTSIYVRLMSENLLIKNYSKYWKFAPSSEGGAEIRQLEQPEMNDLLSSMESVSLSSNVSNVFTEIEGRVKKFSEILDYLEESEISNYFVSLLGEWFKNHNEDPFRGLTTTRLLEAILDKSKKKLLRSPEDIISVVYSALEDYQLAIEEKLGIQKPNADLQGGENTLMKLVTMEDSDDEDAENGDSDDEEPEGDERDHVIQLCFSLISAILMELDTDSDDRGKNDTIIKLQKLIPLVSFVQKHGSPSLKSQARSSLTKLEILASNSSLPEDHQKKSSYKAFLKAVQLMEDPSAPVQAHGMHLLKSLIDAQDESVDFRLALNLYLGKLSEKDSFIYLSAIKGIEALAGRYRFKVIRQLLDTYTDIKSDLDVRLRVGEVFLKFIETYGQVLQADEAAVLIDTMISIVARHDGDADLMRMSAMSILGAFYESAPAVAATRLDDSLDCAMQILRIELDPSKNIMRRSAISLIASVMRGAGVLAIQPQDLSSIRLQLDVASRDEDPLVRSQAATTREIAADMYGL